MQSTSLWPGIVSRNYAFRSLSGELCHIRQGKRSLMTFLEASHTQHCKSSPETVWSIWKDVTNWKEWDDGLECSHLHEGHAFDVDNKISIKPHSTPSPIDLRITECVVNKKFNDTTHIGLGEIQTFHSLEIVEDGVKITHAVKFIPTNEETKKIFESNIWPHMQSGFPGGVKKIAALAEEKYQLLLKG